MPVEEEAAAVGVCVDHPQDQVVAGGRWVVNLSMVAMVAIDLVVVVDTAVWAMEIDPIPMAAATVATWEVVVTITWWASADQHRWEAVVVAMAWEDPTEVATMMVSALNLHDSQWPLFELGFGAFGGSGGYGFGQNYGSSSGGGPMRRADDGGGGMGVGRGGAPYGGRGGGGRGTGGGFRGRN